MKITYDISLVYFHKLSNIAYKTTYNIYKNSYILNFLAYYDN
jgi:hypothetical protein